MLYFILTQAAMMPDTDSGKKPVLAKLATFFSFIYIQIVLFLIIMTDETLNFLSFNSSMYNVPTQIQTKEVVEKQQ